MTAKRLYPLSMSPRYSPDQGAWVLASGNPGPIEVVIKVEGTEADARRYARLILTAVNSRITLEAARLILEDRLRKKRAICE